MTTLSVEEKLQQQLDAYIKFVNDLEQYTDQFDTFCDCDQETSDEDIGIHDDNCQTMLWRRRSEELPYD